jgi:zinc D-Ala-D-Ala carboxypeptidase
LFGFWTIWHRLSFLKKRSSYGKYFKWKEALLLREWDIYALPDEDVAKNIIDMAEVMDQIRILFGKPIVITSWYRPPKYNDDIGGSFKSYHMQGLACDFIVKGYRSDAVREILLEFLDKFDIRMEDLEGASWVHVDLGNPNPNRFFVP